MSIDVAEHPHAIALTFADLPLDPALLATVAELGYEQPSPIQAEAITPLLEGHDLLGQAATGTGKTAAFMLPMLQRLIDRRLEQWGETSRNGGPIVMRERQQRGISPHAGRTLGNPFTCEC